MWLWVTYLSSLHLSLCTHGEYLPLSVVWEFSEMDNINVKFSIKCSSFISIFLFVCTHLLPLTLSITLLSVLFKFSAQILIPSDVFFICFYTYQDNYWPCSILSSIILVKNVYIHSLIYSTEFTTKATKPPYPFCYILFFSPIVHTRFSFLRTRLLPIAHAKTLYLKISYLRYVSLSLPGKFYQMKCMIYYILKLTPPWPHIPL